MYQTLLDCHFSLETRAALTRWMKHDVVVGPNAYTKISSMHESGFGQTAEWTGPRKGTELNLPAIGGSHSPEWMRDINGNIAVVKRHEMSSAQSAAAEKIAADLGNAVGVLVAPVQIWEQPYNGKTRYHSASWRIFDDSIPVSPHHILNTSPQFPLRIAPFDQWVQNIDRKDDSIVGRKNSSGNSTPLACVDHGESLNAIGADRKSVVNISRWWTPEMQSRVRETLDSASEMQTVISNIESMSDARIEDIVRRPPSPLFSAENPYHRANGSRQEITDRLKWRRDSIRDLTYTALGLK